MRKTSRSLQRVLQSPTKHKTLQQTDLQMVSIKGDIWSMELILPQLVHFCQIAQLNNSHYNN